MAKIVFCEDDPVIQKVINIAMRSTPHDVVIAADGEEGLAAIEREQPDAIFSDIYMPRLDGFELADALQERPALAHTPLVFLTASLNSTHREEGRSRGCVGFLPKPFTIGELRSAVEEVLSSGALADRAKPQGSI